MGRSFSVISRELNSCEAVYCRGKCIGSQTDKKVKENWKEIGKNNGTDFDKVTEEKIQYVEDLINNRPMKIFNYLTPNEKYQEQSVAIA